MTLATWWAGALHVFNAAVLAYFCLITVSYLAVTSMSALQVRGYFRRRSRAALRRTLRSRMSPPVTICASAYNEAETIVDSMRAMLTLQYPNYEVALCNDGSTDDKLERLIAAFALRRVDQPIRPGIPTKHVRGVYRSRTDTSLVVIDKENGGRSDGLNAAINAAATPLICCVDADSILEPDGLLSAVRAFLAARTGWSAINGLLIISGAFGVFRRTRVIEVGGFAPDSIGEDFELCMRLHRRAREDRRPYRMEFIPDPVCWTEVPERLTQLGGQRNRWHRGLIDTLWRHRRMIANPRYGVVGLLALPFFVLFEFLGAFIETFGYGSLAVSLALGVVNVPFALLFMAIAILSGVLLSLAAVLLEDLAFRRYGRFRELVKLVFFSVAENFGYRQVITAYRVRGFFAYLRGDKAWGEIQRIGFAGELEAAADGVPERPLTA